MEKVKQINIENEIKIIEQTKNKEQKQFLAYRVAEKVKNGHIIGVGSGTTSFLALQTIAKVIEKEGIKIIAVPTSEKMKKLCEYYNIETKNLNEVNIDWSFDGTDEIDENGNLIKGRGKAMFREKLNFLNSPKVYILADETKYVKKLGEKCAIPIECYPDAIEYVKDELKTLGATNCEIMLEDENPAVTDSNNYIILAKFEHEKINKQLEENLKKITGVIETGLFYGYKNIEVL